MDTRDNTPEAEGRYERSRVNFFGRRAKAPDSAPQTPGRAAQEPSTPAASTTAWAGRPDFPRNGGYRPLSLLGRSAWE